MSSDKGVVTQSENAPVKKRGCGNHCKRFWWAYLAGFIVVAVLVVVLVIFVGVPKIAQKKLDEAELTIDSIIISSTEPKQYNMAVNSTIRTDGKTHATIAPFTGVMYLEDLEPHTPFASVEFPETTSEKLQVVNVSQIVEVTNMDAFTTFNTWLLANETLRMTIEGDTSVKVKGISKNFGVTFKKTVDLKGLNGFHGLKVTDANVDIATTKKNFNGTVDIPNASILTIEIGNATFTNMLNGEEIGTVYMDNLILYPGINNVSIYADVEQAPVLDAMTSGPHCDDGIIPFEMKGKDVTSNGEELEYFAGALRALTQTVEIPLSEAFARNGLKLKCLNTGNSNSGDE
ncbi:hypothetical protein jhhlp_007287 [Lomentospora prolificans]|uniref:Uncharacterized protein n=1 Tax=Lomentospora prolificans TaxID=41688 RepID=A0A2N3N282_9PEZI|nr:hypothetical protein jhhlp_007287 [Lomentospora prolificans]